MATPILNQVSIDLAYKLQDPVSSGTSNGVRLSADERFRYIIRAYRRLLRMVMVLYPDLMQKIYHSFYSTATGTSDSSGIVTSLTDWSEIFEVYCKEPTDEDYVRANFVSPEDYLKIKHEENPFYVASLNTDTYFWTRMGDDMYILPTAQLSYELSYRVDIAKTIEDAGQDGVVDLDIATEYLDLLLSLACSEAYLDIGQGDLATAYANDVNGQLSLLINVSNKMDMKDEDKQT